jgi:hypothetical protein
MTDLTDPVRREIPPAPPPEPVSAWDFFRTELGKTIRVEEDGDGALRVDMLKDGTWAQAPRGMIGLRLSHTTRRLSSQEILALPTPRIRLRDLEIG